VASMDQNYYKRYAISHIRLWIQVFLSDQVSTSILITYRRALRLAENIKLMIRLSWRKCHNTPRYLITTLDVRLDTLTVPIRCYPYNSHTHTPLVRLAVCTT
jgi:hypothetical protein